MLKINNIGTPVIHHREFWADSTRDEIVITTGSEIGGLLCDGLGDGILLDAPSEDVDYLRTTSFGLLQVYNHVRDSVSGVEIFKCCCRTCNLHFSLMHDCTGQVELLRARAGHYQL